MSDEALRAAKRLFRGEAWITTQQIERAAEIIDREFSALRNRASALERQVDDLLGNEVHLAEAEMERDELRKELDNLRAREIGL